MDTSTTSVTDSSDQDLVDVYAIHAGNPASTEMTSSQIQVASQAAYALEIHGYFEQSGIWVHDHRPALHATT